MTDGVIWKITPQLMEGHLRWGRRGIINICDGAIAAQSVYIGLTEAKRNFFFQGIYKIPELLSLTSLFRPLFLS